MKFKKLARYLERLEKTSSRIEITKILAELFKESSKEEIDKIVYLLLGRLAPRYDTIVFNLADKMMVRVIAKAYKKDSSYITNLYKQKGDLGNVAEELAKSKGVGLSVNDVYERLHKIAVDEGLGSQERKINDTANLLSKLDPLSTRFVARIPVGKLRLGFSDKTIIDALSWMRRGDKSASKKIEKTYHKLPDVGTLAKRIKEMGISKGSSGIAVEVGIPVLPMLAQRLKSPGEMIEKMEEVAVEPKLDGLRILLHFKSGKNGFVKAFTRNLNETGWMFPELEKIEKYVKAKEVILDTEAVGLDENSIKRANFQTTMTRRRKHDIGEKAGKVPLKFYCFDLLYKDGRNYIDKAYLERRKELETTIIEGSLFKLVKSVTTKDPKVISKLNIEMVSKGFEGILVKRVDSKYVPGRTGWRWVKMKEEEGKHAKLADTVDAVVMGYTRGKGRRSQFGVGQFLAGVVDKGKVRTLTKVGTGLTDEQFRTLNKKFKKIDIDKKPERYEANKLHEPDYWVKPKLVVEIAADEITKSPTHTSGFALRFPRLIKFRDDKGVKQATSLKEIISLHKLQS